VEFWVVLGYESSDSEAVAAEVLLSLDMPMRNVEGEKGRKKPCSSHKEHEPVLDRRISQYQARGPR